MLFAAADQAGAFLLADFNVAEDLFDLTAVDLGAHLRVFQPGQADFDAVESFGQFGDELVVDPFLDEDAGAGAADLTLVEEDAQLGAVHGHVPIAVVEEDIRRFAAQFQCRRDEFSWAAL